MQIKTTNPGIAPDFIKENKMNTYYKNINDDLLTQSQVEKMSSYVKVYEDKGQIIKEELYEDSKLDFVDYFKNNLQTHAEIVTLMQNNGVKKFAIIENNDLGDFVVKYYTEYENNDILFKHRHLYKREDEPICHEFIDTFLNTPKYKETQKFFYDHDYLDDEPILECFYNADGTFREMRYRYHIDDQDADYYFPGDDLSILRGYLGLSEIEFAYYVSATFEP